MPWCPRLFACVATAALLAACNSEPKVDVQVEKSPSPQPTASAAVTPAGSAAEPALPASHPAVSLPAGHPPVGQGMPPGGVPMPPVAPGGQVEAALFWTVPNNWIAEKPANEMRRAQYRVPGAGGEGECVVFYFGPGQGGAPMDNAERWASQFTAADGKPQPAALKTRAEEVGGIKVLYVETAGTYMSGGMMGGPVTAKPGWALYGAIAQGPDSNWFFKFTGPAPTVKAQRGAFEAMIRSLKRGA